MRNQSTKKKGSVQGRFFFLLVLHKNKNVQYAMCPFALSLSARLPWRHRDSTSYPHASQGEATLKLLTVVTSFGTAYYGMQLQNESNSSNEWLVQQFAHNIVSSKLKSTCWCNDHHVSRMKKKTETETETAEQSNKIEGNCHHIELIDRTYSGGLLNDITAHIIASRNNCCHMRNILDSYLHLSKQQKPS